MEKLSEQTVKPKPESPSPVLTNPYGGGRAQSLVRTGYSPGSLNIGSTAGMGDPGRGRYLDQLAKEPAK